MVEVNKHIFDDTTFGELDNPIQVIRMNSSDQVDVDQDSESLVTKLVNSDCLYGATSFEKQSLNTTGQTTAVISVKDISNNNNHSTSSASYHCHHPKLKHTTKGRNQLIIVACLCALFMGIEIAGKNSHYLCHCLLLL